MAFIKVTMIDDCQFSNDLVFLEGIKTYKKYFTNYDFYLHLIEGKGITPNRLLLLEEVFDIKLSKNLNYNLAKAVLNKIE
jgi:hypothetical protein